MIKYFKYIFAAAIVMMAAVGCQDDIEDSFSKNPVAPVLNNNGSILLTQNTMSEDVTWAWKAARFLPGETQYALYAEYQGSQKVQVGTATSDLNITMTKPAFQKVLEGFTGIPENSSFDLTFTVVATDNEYSLSSEKQLMKVYSYGDAVSAVVTTLESDVVLDVNTPTEALSLISWTDARLTYGEGITYKVYISYNGGKQYEVASGLTELTLSKTVDEWNEAVVAAGAPESQASNIEFVVSAISESYPAGVPSEPVTINITTYTATYPAVMYLPGSHQGWDPATAPTIPLSTLNKGLYEAFINLSAGDGGNVSFKFSPNPAWEGDFGASNVEVTTDANGNLVVTATAGGGDNIEVPSGLYRIKLNKKFNTLLMVRIESMGMIGSATVGGWNDETPMTYDANARTYSVVTTLTNGEAYKFRANNNWEYSIADRGSFDEGSDYVFAKETGEYKVVLDVTKHPYEVKYLSTSYPEKLYLPGSYQGWSPATASTLMGNGEGVFEGGINLVDEANANCEFKFSPVPEWAGDFGATITWTDDNHASGTYGGSSNISVPNGYYYIKLDMTTGEVALTRINKVGLIGDFNSWGGDEEMTYDVVNNIWVGALTINDTDKFKVRMNGEWSMNRGLGIKDNASLNITYPSYHDGENIGIGTAGTYTIKLDMSVNPNTITISK